MKQTLLIVGVILSNIAHAQINLEHTFENYVKWSGDTYYEYAIVTPENAFYVESIDDNTLTEIVYANDYTVKETNKYNFTAPEGYEVTAVAKTKYMFDNDDDFEFFVTFNKTESAFDDTRTKLHLVDESNTLIKDFGSAYQFQVITQLQLVDNKGKFLLYKYNNETSVFDTEVYSTPYTPQTNAVGTVQKASFSVYPNPTDAQISINYPINATEAREIKILNATGVLISSYLAPANSSRIILDVSSYTPGLYIYEIDGVSKKFIKN